jgi:nucleoside-diphosphate-sugar epimerase
MYIDDCVLGTQKLMESSVREPINIGSSELVTINQLLSVVEEIGGVELERRYLLDAPQGVRGRNSDNTFILDRLNWEPRTPLREGMRQTYDWIYAQMVDSSRPPGLLTATT